MKTKLAVFFLGISFYIGALAAEEKSSEACRKAYEKLYANDVINMTFAVGHMWGDDESRDAIVTAEFVQTLKRRCEGSERLCGFTQSSDDAELFLKKIEGPGGKIKTVRFRILNTTLYPVTFRNAKGNGYIGEKFSLGMLEKFKEALQSDQVVVYQGHAQSGRGLGVSSPEWPIESMTQFIRKLEKKPAVLGVIACDAEGHYGNKLHAAAPDAALVLTRQKTMIDDGLGTAKATFESLLSRKCEEQFASAYRKATDFFYYGPWELETDAKNRAKTPNIFGFFKPIERAFPVAPDREELHEKYDSQRRVYSPTATSN